MSGNQDLKRVIQKARRKLEASKTQAKYPESINDVFDRCSPEFEHPDHLRPYVDQLERAVRDGDVAICFHAPPQHGKSVTSQHALIYYAFARPGLRHAYVTYGWERAKAVKDEVYRLAEAAGLDPHSAGQLLTLKGGTSINFVGRGGGLTGNPIDGILIVDDILKDDQEARSPTTREACWNWFLTVALTRCHPGSSKLVMNTRWSLDDLPGRLIDRSGWDYIRLAARCDSPEDPSGREIGQCLWDASEGQKGRPESWLRDQEIAVGPRAWESMYQGNPRAEGDALFGDPSWYHKLPDGPYRNLHGTDLAYTTKTRGDWSVLLSGRLYQNGEIYLTKCLRMQVQADVFTARMGAVVQQAPGTVLWYGSTTERGVSQLIKQTIPSFLFRLATTDKYVRALPTAEKLWNTGKIHLPLEAEWSRGFAKRVTEFTGEDGGCDDEVDALAAIGDLGLQFGTHFGLQDLNRQVRRAVRGHLRAV